jgi:plastocyanin
MKHNNDYGAKLIIFMMALAAIWTLTTENVLAGTIKGMVRFTGAPVTRKTFPVTIDQYLCGKEKTSEELVLSQNNGIKNAVVALQGLPPGLKGPKNPTSAKIDQKECVFIPRVVVVPVGGTVEFLNSDRLLHNVRSSGKDNPPFNRAQPHARTISINFKSPEILRVDCDLHSWMRGWVVVTDHPFYAVTDEKGEFTFEGVPPGKYRLDVWQEVLGRVSQEVTVAGEGVREVTVPMRKK